MLPPVMDNIYKKIRAKRGSRESIPAFARGDQEGEKKYIHI